MCVPVAAALIASTVISAGTAIYGGIQQNQQAQYAATMDQRNANIATQQVNVVNQQSADAQLQKYRQIAAVKGQQIAGYAASGLNVGFGSPSDVVSGTAMMGEEDAQRIRDSYTQRANEYIVSADNYRAQAAGERAAGQSALIGGALGAAGSIFKGASQVGSYNAANGGPPSTSGGFASTQAAQASFYSQP